MKAKLVSGVVVFVLLAACASGPPTLPYPAFVQVDELEDIFMASLPGIRAKQLAGDPQTRRTSNRIDLPPDWSGTTGGSPGRSLEIFVISGQLMIADIELRRGGYAYLPAGSLGFNLRSDDGARILYFLNDVESRFDNPLATNHKCRPAAVERDINDGRIQQGAAAGPREWFENMAAEDRAWQSAALADLYGSP